MKSRWTIFWIAVLLAGLGLVARELFFQKASSPEPPKGTAEETTPVPQAEKVEIQNEEIARWEAAFKSKKELWRSDVVEVVKHERERLGIPASAQIREHGEYLRRPNGGRRTLVFALSSGLDVGAQKTVLLEERPSGIWVPIEVGPFFMMVDRVGK